MSASETSGHEIGPPTTPSEEAATRTAGGGVRTEDVLQKSKAMAFSPGALNH